jgi:nucleoid-associated protein YgaU
MSNDNAKKDNQNKNKQQDSKSEQENMKEKFPQIVVGVVAVIAIIFGLFYFNNKTESQNGEGGREAISEEGSVAGEGQNATEEAAMEGQPTPEPTQTPISPDQKEYTVQEGDSLWSIAERKYGSGYNYVDIIEANDLQNPDYVAPGIKLTLPDAERRGPDVAMEEKQEEQAQDQQEKKQADEKEEKETAGDKTPDSQKTEYVVKEGDTLAMISEKVYGSQEYWQRIAEANQIMNPDMITVGTKLIIPRK